LEHSVKRVTQLYIDFDSRPTPYIRTVNRPTLQATFNLLYYVAYAPSLLE